MQDWSVVNVQKGSVILNVDLKIQKRREHLMIDLLKFSDKKQMIKCNLKVTWKLLKKIWKYNSQSKASSPKKVIYPDV